MALALDGFVIGNATGGKGGGVTLNVSLTTLSANDVIVIVTDCFQGQIDANGLSDTAGLVWSRKANFQTSVPSEKDIWWAVAAAPLTADDITVVSSNGANLYACAFGVSGADTAAPFDTSPSLPSALDAPGGTSSFMTFSTVAAKTLAFCIYGFTDEGAAAPGPGWSAIAPAGSFEMTQYRIFAAAQTNQQMTLGSDVGNQNTGIGHVIVAPASASEWLIRARRRGRR